ncbi:pilus assembly protein [Streptomyces sp. NBC_00237]|uniref:TadE/TadG family type IV pilus assembly protein n=1 Tax=Streptomyces sp. NBC_00237 TaxID=2975687 RepID=UPI00224FBE09|nr:TadE/TadG family type IV pilus assembly protein [Streptomyces sp. NBC_00237]MCX5204942.1 pilus assembly protein [Streptomyces sp. NBC_00237]
MVLSRVRDFRIQDFRIRDSRVRDGLRRRAEAARGRGQGQDRGLSTVEVVILAPVMILFLLILVGLGQLVDGRGAVDGAARDAARAGSLQKDGGQAVAEAERAAEADLADVCAGPVTVRQTSGAYAEAEFFSVEVSCRIRGLALLGLDIPAELSGRSTSPIDPYRRKS